MKTNLELMLFSNYTDSETIIRQGARISTSQGFRVNFRTCINLIEKFSYLATLLPENSVFSMRPNILFVAALLVMYIVKSSSTLYKINLFDNHRFRLNCTLDRHLAVVHRNRREFSCEYCPERESNEKRTAHHFPLHIF